MKITVRLYRTTDLDLIGLACADGMSVSKELKKCLVSFVRGMPYSINLNPIDVSSVIMTKKAVTLQFYLEPKSYSDVINWLKTIRTRQRNSFLKNLLRSSLPCPYLYMYQTNQTLVNNMITDIYDRQIELELEEENNPVTPVTPVKPIKKTVTPVTVAKPTTTSSVPTPTPIVNTPTPEPIRVVEEPKPVPQLTPISSTTNNEDTSDTILNNTEQPYDAEAEDALFDALFNL